MKGFENEVIIKCSLLAFFEREHFCHLNLFYSFITIVLSLDDLEGKESINAENMID